MAQISTTSVTQDELSQILAGNVDSIILPTEEKKDDKKEEVTNESTLDSDFKWDELTKLVETESDTKEEDKEEPKLEEETKKVGRKPADVVSFVNELIEAKDLLGFEEGEPKTIEEAKEIIRLNLKHSKETSLEEAKNEIKSSYSPQIQAILQYADQGGEDITTLMSAITEIEKTAEFDVNQESGQVSIITEFLKVQGWDDEDIKEEIETSKDLGKLKVKAEKFLPKLNQMKSERIEMMMEESKEKAKKVEETRRNYLATIQETLNQEKLGDVKLTRQEKGKLWNAVADLSYKSFNGSNTNAFYKKIEEIQVGKTADYNHFLELVYFAVDREGYKQKLMEELKTMEASTTARKLKIQQTKATSNTSDFSDETPRKATIKRGFRNPWQ